jgi:hypothetical protein
MSTTVTDAGPPAAPTPPGYTQLRVANQGCVRTAADYRLAAEILWGEAGAWAVDEYARLNARCFAGELPPLPVVIGLTAFGRCLGLTRYRGEWPGGLPRISLQSGLFARGTGAVGDILLHEMVHARLTLAGLDPRHNGGPWCAEVERLSREAFGAAARAEPVHPRRVNGVSVRQAREGCLTRKQLASWPLCLRPPGIRGRVIPVSSY